MNPFRYERARDPYSAVTLLAGAPNGVFLAGGTNLVDHLKLGVREPDLLVDITHLPYDRIEPLPDGGIRIGAMVRNADLAADRDVGRHGQQRHGGEPPVQHRHRDQVAGDRSGGADYRGR